MKKINQLLQEFTEKNCYKKGERGYASKEDLKSIVDAIELEIAKREAIAILVGAVSLVSGFILGGYIF